MKNATLLTLGLAVALTACNQEDHTIVAGGPADDGYNEAAEANIVLPPSIAASKIYRCADGKVLYVDWLSDNKSANIRTDKAGTPTNVMAAEAGQPMSGPEGYSLDGTADAASVRIGVPGAPAQSCKS